MAAEQLVLAYCDGTVFSFERAERLSPSWFGGPLEARITGIKFGPSPLHMIARLARSDFAGSSRSDLFDIPLIYGVCYEACDLEYRVDDVGKIELRQLDPTESSDDWPYPNYPPLLPHVPLQLGEARLSTYEAFAEPLPNMPRLQPTELVVVVPAPATLGVSLWGKYGDGDVVILFECDLEKRVVYASNRCT
jgi:hypothetical protein